MSGKILGLGAAFLGVVLAVGLSLGALAIAGGDLVSPTEPLTLVPPRAVPAATHSAPPSRNGDRNAGPQPHTLSHDEGAGDFFADSGESDRDDLGGHDLDGDGDAGHHDDD